MCVFEVTKVLYTYFALFSIIQSKFVVLAKDNLT